MRKFVCHVGERLDEETRERWREACEKLDFYREHEGQQYCVLHYPGDDKEKDFKSARESKLANRDYDFSGTIFPQGTSDFEDYELGPNTKFSGAISCESELRWNQVQGAGEFSQCYLHREG
jgi:hypothetical protein